MKKELLVISLVFLLFAVNCESRGIGVRSGSMIVSINFVPNFEQTYYYSVVPFSDEPMDITMYIENDGDDGTTTSLSQYFIVDPPLFKNVLPKTEPFFKVTVRLPKEIKEPGNHKIHVGVAEAMPETGGISVRAAVEAIFYINVPFDGQYLRYSFNAKNVNQGNPIPIEIAYTNRGTEPINNIYSSIDLLDSSKKIIANVKIDSFVLGSQEEKKQKAEISTMKLSPGEYNVNLTVYHDGKQDYSSQDVKIGELTFKILNQTSTLFSGKMDEIWIDAESQWAEPVKGVYAEIKIGENPAIRTLSEDFNGFQKMRLKGFFDATNMNPGDYDMAIKLYFEDKIVSKTTTISLIKENKFEMPSLSPTNMIFLIVIIMIIIINITLFFILMKKKDEKEKERE